MATETLPAVLGAPRLAGASKGVSLSTTAAYTVLPRGTRFLSMVGRNYSTAVVARWTLCPWLTVFKTTDLCASAANITDYTDNAQDGSTSTDVTLSNLDTLANLDAVFIGSQEQFGGLVVDVDAANGTASTILVQYWNGSAWTDISATDGTASGGAALAVDGNITWTVPAAWVPVSIKDTMTGVAQNVGVLTHDKFWVRVSFSAGLDSSTTLNSIIAIEGSAAYAELIASQVWEQAITVGEGGYSSVVALTDAGTANLIVNCAPRGRFA